MSVTSMLIDNGYKKNSYETVDLEYMLYQVSSRLKRMEYQFKTISDYRLKRVGEFMDLALMCSDKPLKGTLGTLEIGEVFIFLYGMKHITQSERFEMINEFKINGTEWNPIYYGKRKCKTEKMKEFIDKWGNQYEEV